MGGFLECTPFVAHSVSLLKYREVGMRELESILTEVS